MPTNCNKNGRAFEYICLMCLNNEIAKYQKVNILNNSSLQANKKAWDELPSNTQSLLKFGALAAVNKIFELEPNILDSEANDLTLSLQQDKKGEEGDVRDIIIARSSIKWEIGLSLKHNHFAAKHSRLSQKLDFGEKWYSIPCSDEYWKKIKPIFDFLKQCKKQKLNWDQLEDKETKVYEPLLDAFMEEIKKSYNVDNTIASKLVLYLLGKFDFYKIVSIDRFRITKIQGYNIRGNLNKPSIHTSPKTTIPTIQLPHKIIHIGYKTDNDNIKSMTTIELYLDSGWQFSFRIHNASKKIETSLKFDVQFVGLPAVITNNEISCYW